MGFTGQEQHDISFTDASNLTKRYRGQMAVGDRKGGYFGGDAIQALLDQRGCVGIRYYYGLDEDERQVLVVVGVDADENDIIDTDALCIEASVPCPSQCGDDNVLNS